MVSSIVYSGDGTTRIFPVDFKILGENFVRVYVDDVEVTDKRKYDIINNSIVFNEEETPQVGVDNITILIATSESELGDLGAPITDIMIVAQNIADINAVGHQIVPNLAEILQADDNATIATTKAGEALASATSASGSATTATTQAGIATTKAGEASTSASNASTSATTATAQVGIAATKASEANASAISASTSASEASVSASQALTSRNQAETFAQQASASATSVDANNIVHRTGDESIAGVKTFSSSPIVPTPTAGTQAANKAYADTKITLSTANSYDLGVGQTWQDVTSSRSVGVTYTNTTGKPIMVYFGGYIGASADIYGHINNVLVSKLNILNASGTVNLLVPNGSTYKYTISNGSLTINMQSWFELR